MLLINLSLPIKEEKKKKRKPFWAGGVAQETEQLPHKCEAMNSNPSTKKKKRKNFLSKSLI
jgi:hypothetical protein